MKIIVIGGGPAGRTAAIEAAQIGEDVTLIEKDKLGGKCLNEGCMVVSGLNDVAKFKRDSEKYKNKGITSQAVEVDFDKLAEGVRETIKKLREVNETETLKAGVEILKGAAQLENNKVLLDGDVLSYDKLIVATGAGASIPNLKGSEHGKTYRDVLDFKRIPQELIIIGSGVIAAEFASIFSMLGSKVHVLCRNQFLKMVDNDLKGYVLRKLLQDVQIQENIQVEEITEYGLLTDKGRISGDVLFATGMKPNSKIVEDLVNLGERGEIRVNQQMQTSNPDIYAAGDVVGGVGTTPAARMEGVVAARNACSIYAEADYSIIPGSISLYYDVAFINNKIKADEDSLIEGSIPGFAGPGSFWNVLDRNTGFTKVKIDSETGAIKDVSTISPSARTSIAYLAQMMKDNYSSYDFDGFIETHPSTDPIYKLLRLFAKFG
jgi:dihydrolipoamide dehydrogenase